MPCFCFKLQMIILFILSNYVACMISLRKSNVEKMMMSIRKFEKWWWTLLHDALDVFKEGLKEVQEMRKSYKMRAYVWRRVFLAQEKQEGSLVLMLRIEAPPLKEALPKGGSIIILFCHAGAPRVNWLAKGQGCSHNISS